MVTSGERNGATRRAHARVRRSQKKLKGEREETQPNRTPTGAWGTTNAGIDRDGRSFIRGIA